jgi:flagellar assembly protein FliH
LSEAAVSYDFEQLEPSQPAPPDTPARLIAQAMAESERIRELAHAEGLAAGRAQAREDVAAAAAALAEALAGVEALRTGVVEGVERDAVELALAIAGKILAGALQASPELVLEVVQGALRRVSDRRQITVLLNPADLDLVQAAELETFGHCELQSDQRVEPGGAIVRTVEGEVDACVTTQLERAREVLGAALQAGREPA